MSETSARAGLAEVLGEALLGIFDHDEASADVESQELADVVLAYLAKRLGSAGMREAVNGAVSSTELFEDGWMSGGESQVLTDATLAAVAAGLGVALDD